MWVAETADVPPSHRHDVVLVHGLGVSSAYFQHLAVTLARFGTVHLVELPGFAGVPHPDRSLSTTELGALVAGWIRDADLTEATATLRLPVLAMVGEADGSTPPDLVRAMAERIPGARFEIIPNAGHIPGVEQPAVVARLIGGFLTETGFLKETAHA